MLKTKTSAKRRNTRLKECIQVSLFTAIIAVCSLITIPAPIPFTLQTLGIFCALAVLGFKKGFTSIILYIFIGLAGIPVFSGFSAGIGHLMGATGGYITGFVFIALIYGVFTHKKCKPLFKAIGLIVGLMVCYLFGTLWYVTVYLKELSFSAIGSAFIVCVLPFIIPDLIKLLVAVSLDRKIPESFR